MANCTPLRYPGGKARLRPYLAQLIISNDLLGGHYVEPFCGGAGLALELLYSSIVSDIHLNDLDRAVYAFWESAVNRTDELCTLIESTPCNMETWFLQRDVWKNKESANLLELGFATFFLNRTNRSGILGAGVIGGKDQAGIWKIDARYNLSDLLLRIRALSKHRSRIHVSNTESQKFLLQLPSYLPDRSFIYLDPPYVEKGPGLYLNHYTDADHRSLAKLVKEKLIYRWMVSYDDHSLIRECYGTDAKIEMNFPYSAYGNARRGSELVYFSEGLKPPVMDKVRRRFHQPWEV